MNKLTYRQAYILLTGLSFFILACSFYFQYVQGLQPCPLCLMQRFCVFLLSLVCLLGIYTHQVNLRKILVVLLIIVSFGGLFFAVRQLWLQSLPPDQVPACLPELDVLIHYFSWHDVLHALFWGTGNCAEVSWSLLGLSMPAWSAFYFLFMLAVAIFIFSAMN